MWKPKARHLLVVCAAAGIAINSIYYIIRFDFEGVPLWLSLVLSFTLIGFETFLFIYRDMNKWLFLPLWFLVFAYSVLSTQAGQHFYLSEVRNSNILEVVEDLNNSESKSLAQKEVDRLDKQIELKQKEIDNMPEKSPAWVKSQLEAEKMKLETSRSQWALKLLDKTESQKSSNEVKKESTDIYQYYAGGNAKLEKKIQFGFHFVASIIFALISPICLYIYNFKPNEEKEKKDEEEQKEPEQKKEKQKPEEIDKKMEAFFSIVDKYANLRFMGVKPGYRLNDKKFVLQSFEGMSEDQYDYITKLAIAKNLIINHENFHFCRKDIDEKKFAELIKEFLRSKK